MRRSHNQIVIEDVKRRGTHVANKNITVYHLKRALEMDDFDTGTEKFALCFQWCAACYIPLCVPSLRSTWNIVVVEDNATGEVVMDNFRWKTPTFGVEVYVF